MDRFESRAAELIAEIRKMAEQFMNWQEDLVHRKLADLNQRDAGVILLLGQAGACSMSELAQKIKLTVSSATLIIDRLVDRGLVSRHRSLDDRRVVRVALTQEGTELHRVMFETLVRFGKAMLSALDDREQEQLLALYRKVTASLPRQ
ncbi:MAG TPA: MarR family transcriptional regulator [Bacteroidota bacterium]|nr:MarR family transcriptional regulator [Bacteroidota bacterium]